MVLVILLSFAAGAACAVLVPRLVAGLADKWIFPTDRREVARATSPDGAVDAVIDVIECGAPCSSRYEVFLIPRTAASETNAVQPVFVADYTVNTQARWMEPHLLDISYDKAFILSFHNVVYPLGRPGNEESWRYAVEVRLSPSSSRFSYLSEANPGSHGQ